MDVGFFIFEMPVTVAAKKSIRHKREICKGVSCVSPLQILSGVLILEGGDVMGYG
jgi:hypothetical protein